MIKKTGPMDSFVITRFHFIVLFWRKAPLLPLAAKISLLVLLACCPGRSKKPSDPENPVEDRHGVRPPSRCEVCKLLAYEIKKRMNETETAEVIQLGSTLDGRRQKSYSYKTSELRLTEVLEDPNVCDRMLKYSLHKEKKDSTRFAPGIPQTFQTLNELVGRGVKVDLGIPQELWKEPAAEVTSLQKKCYTMLADNKDDIEEWYFKKQDEIDLSVFLCKNIILSEKEHGCLYEGEPPLSLLKQPALSSDKSDKKDEL